MTQALSPSPRILIVDDDEALREALAMSVESFGYESCTEAGVDAALVLVARESVSVILCDLNMPGRTGLCLLSELRDLGYRQPFILMTGCLTLEAYRSARRLGVFEILEKPVEDDQLRQALAAALA